MPCAQQTADSPSHCLEVNLTVNPSPATELPARSSEPLTGNSAPLWPCGINASAVCVSSFPTLWSSQVFTVKSVPREQISSVRGNEGQWDAAGPHMTARNRTGPHTPGYQSQPAACREPQEEREAQKSGPAFNSTSAPAASASECSCLAQ